MVNYERKVLSQPKKETQMNTNQKRLFILKHMDKTTTWLASKLKISTRTVRDHKAQIKALGLKPNDLKDKKRTAKEAVEEDIAVTKNREEKNQLQSKYKYVLRESDALKKLLAAKDGQAGVETYTIKTTKGESHETVAFVLWSDWHVEERVTPGQVSGVNEYNLDVAQARAEKLAVNTAKLVKIFQKDSSIKKIVVFLGGDFISGNLHEDSTEHNQLGTMEAMRFAKKLIASGLKYLLANTDCEIVCVCHSGNHGRITKRIHWGTENQNSVEWMAYQDMAEFFAGEKRMTFVIPEGDISYMQVYDKHVRFLHGHSVKFGGGIGGLTIPMRKAISQWDKVQPAMLTCFGHFHQRIHGGGSSAFIGNGSLIGYNAYGQSIKAEYEEPAQQFFLVSSRNGGEVTVVCPVWLD